MIKVLNAKGKPLPEHINKLANERIDKTRVMYQPFKNESGELCIKLGNAFDRDW